MRLENKIGIVTAAASGMGRAGVLRFAREGASVAVVDYDADGVAAVVDAVTSAGGRAHGVVADLRDEQEAKRIVADTVAAFGGLDFVWNHLGHPGPAAVEDMDYRDLEQALDLNLRSEVATTEAAIPHLRARASAASSPALLYTASTAGLVGSANSPVYSMVKFGVVGFVKSLSLRLAPENIRVNAVCPGPIDTPMLRVFVKRPDEQAKAGMDAEQLVKARQDKVPMRRNGHPDEVANAALFLISDEASYITGAALPVDGGFTAG